MVQTDFTDKLHAVCFLWPAIHSCKRGLQYRPKDAMTDFWFQPLSHLTIHFLKYGYNPHSALLPALPT